MRSRILSLTIFAILALMVVGIVTTPASAGPSFEFENWGTQFSPNNPLVCSGGICSRQDVKTDIQPGTQFGTVDRTATITSTGSFSAQTFMTGSPMCSGLMMDEGSLVLTNSPGSISSLTLAYTFNFHVQLDNISLLIAN